MSTASDASYPRATRRQTGATITHRAPSLLAMLAQQVPDWMEEALCRDADPDLFFPERGVNTGPAKAICARCPVQQECLEYGDSFEGEYRVGIWGGTSPRQRQQLSGKSLKGSR